MTVARRVVRVGRDLMALGDLSFHGIDPIARNSIANTVKNVAFAPLSRSTSSSSLVSSHGPSSKVSATTFSPCVSGVVALHDGVDGVVRYLDDLLFSRNLAGFGIARTVLPLLGDDVQRPMSDVLGAMGDGLVFGRVGRLFDIDSVFAKSMLVWPSSGVSAAAVGSSSCPSSVAVYAVPLPSCSSSPSISSMLPAVAGEPAASNASLTVAVQAAAVLDRSP